MVEKNTLSGSKRKAATLQSINKQKTDKTKNSIKDKTMEKWYYIATYALAVIAIAGFGVSIFSSHKTSKTMNELVNSLTSFIEPVLKFHTISYLVNPQSLNCENPPQVINYQYKNASNIPIKVLQYEIKSYFGDEIVHPQKDHNADIAQSILEPGSIWGVLTAGISKPVQEMMKNKRGIFSPPFLRIEFTGVISTIDELKKYEVHLVHQIGIDCDSYAVGLNITTLSEVYKEVITKK